MHDTYTHQFASNMKKQFLVFVLLTTFTDWTMYVIRMYAKRQLYYAVLLPITIVIRHEALHVTLTGSVYMDWRRVTKVEF